MTLEEKYQFAINLLADWVNSVRHNGTGWDDWDECYKTADGRPSIIKEDLDKAILAGEHLYKDG